MNKRIKKLASKAGFVMWKDECYRPEGAVVDWAADYDEELEEFANLIVAKAIKRINKSLKTLDIGGITSTYEDGMVMGLLYSREYLENLFENSGERPVEDLISSGLL